jgi:UDP-glucuronate 4-epimerase
MNNANKEIVLTGGAGFIGSHVAEALLRRGAHLTILDCLDDFYSQASKRANLEDVRRAGEYNFIELDICDFGRLRDVLRAIRPEAIIHLAARAGVRPSIERPRLYEAANVAGTLNLLEICREQEVRKFVFGSSSSVYGVSTRTPFAEDQVELKPISPYAATKLSGEMLCYTYAHLYDLEVVCLRLFTVYGPRQRPDLAIHKFFSLINEGKPIPFYGDGTSGRDYTYVGDIVSGVLAALDYRDLTLSVGFNTFNLGNAHPVSLAELVRAIERVSGRKATLDQREMQPGDVPITWANIERASRMLGYKPATSLDEGLRKFAEWYESRASYAIQR